MGLDRSRSRAAIRAAHAASWAYVLLIVAVCGFLCLFMLMPGQLFLLFATGLPDSASIRVVRGYADTWSVGTWHQSMQIQNATDMAAMSAFSSSIVEGTTVGQPDPDLINAGFHSAAAAQAVTVTTSQSDLLPLPEAETPDSSATEDAVLDLVAAAADSASQGTVAVLKATLQDAPAAVSAAQGTVEPLQDTLIEGDDSTDMVSALLENRTMLPAASTPWLMGVEVHKTPAEWQEEYLRLYAGEDDMNFQSSGHVSPWFGDFMEPGAMESLLNARAYKKEIILTVSDVNHLEPLFNLLLDFKALKMQHTVVLMDQESSCDAVRQHMPDVGCVWTSFLVEEHPTPYWTPIVHLWLMRWLLFNSMARRGYNVLILDTDNSVRMDPYPFLKSSMFKGFHQLVSYDEGIPEINCGIQYSQNISPDGPMAWITAEVVDRLLRWTENWEWFVARLNSPKELDGDTFFRVTFEQSVFRDATCSAMVGRPRFYHSLSPRDKKWPFPFWDPDWRERHTKECRWWNTTASTPIPPLWQLVARKPEQVLNHVTLRLPESKGEYPTEWGHEPFPAERGKFSTRFQEWLKQDVAEIWPDVESAEDPGGKRQKEERMVQVPMWFFSRWIEIGQDKGAWNLHPPMGVINHALVPGGRDNILKTGIMKLYGWWNWEASNIVKGPGSTSAAKHVDPATNDKVVPKIIAIAPSVELMFSDREDVHKSLLNTLIIAALASNRTPALPLVPCDSPWLHHRTEMEYSARGIDSRYVEDRSVVQFGPKDDLRCFWKAWSCAKCDDMTIPWYDFQHLLKDAPLQDRSPNEGNTILYDHMDITRRTVVRFAQRQQGMEVDTVPQLVQFDKLMEELDDLKDREIVWVGAVLTPDTDSIPAPVAEMLQLFDEAVAICPDC